MRTLAALLVALAALPSAAQKPWELRVDVPVGVPVELPRVPLTNPFAGRLATQPVVLTSPFAEKTPLRVTAVAAVYIDAVGTCRRIVFTALPLPGLTDDLKARLAETEFAPAKMLGAAVPTWVTVAVDLEGRLDDATAKRVTLVPPDPTVPPVPDVPPTPAPDARDLQLPATPAGQLDQAPMARRFRVKVSGQELAQRIRMMVEVDASGRAARVVFLSCPEGLRPWLLASLSNWTFQPGQDAHGPVAAWGLVEADLTIKLGALRSDALRIIRRSEYPTAERESADGRPPGE